MLPLNEDQIRTLKSAIDRIVPADDFPSASQSGGVDFLTSLIAREGLAEIYKAGLAGLELEARKLDCPFAELDASQQDLILSWCERRRASEGWTVSPRVFFNLLARQAVEGYYADPGNGGNREAASWKMVGFEVHG